MRIPLIILLMAATIRAAPSQEIDPAVSAILKANCAECHSDATRTSGFSVSSSGSVFAGGNKYGKAVIAGHPAGSPLLKLLRGELQPQMPMGKKLAGADIDRIEQWIRSLPAQAAQAATEWRWPFEKPVKKAAPSVRNAAWLGNEIDAFILAQLEQKGISPAPPASPRTLARRAYYDLIGLPPTPEEMEAFVADPSPNAYEKLIDRLLADPRYGERWGRHWLDLVRYGETSGLEGDGSDRERLALSRLGDRCVQLQHAL